MIVRFCKRSLALLLSLTLTIQLLAVVTELPLANATPKLKIGDYVNFGTYNARPILWRIIEIDKAGNPLLFSDKIISLKAFDAAGNFHNEGTRRINGSNNYENSNIRQWLNSSEGSIKWLQNQPVKANMLDKFSGYDNEKGFLADGNFTSWERSIIVPTTNRVILHNVDADKKMGGTTSLVFQQQISRSVQNHDTTAFYTQLTDKVFLLSVRQLFELVYKRGFDIRAKPTPQVVNNSVSIPGLGEKENWHYWLSTPNGQQPGSVRFVFFDGMVNKYFAYSDIIGVRPAVRLNAKSIGLTGSGTGSLSKPYQINRNSSSSTQTPGNSGNSSTANTLRVVGKQIFMNNKSILPSNGPVPTRINGQMMVPLRNVAQAAGLTISSDSRTKAVTIAKRGYSLRLTPGRTQVLVNGKLNKTMAVPVTNVRGALMVHGQFLARELGYRFSVQ